MPLVGEDLHFDTVKLVNPVTVEKKEIRHNITSVNTLNKTKMFELRDKNM